MSTVSFSGLATGLNTDSIITQLVELRRAPVYRLQTARKGYQDQISGLSTLKTKLLALQTAAKKMDTAAEFSSAKATSNLSEALTVSAGGTASPGQYEIFVNTLATAQKIQSQGYDSKLNSVGSGPVSLTVGGTTTSLNLVGVTTLEGLAKLINDNVEGVSASIVNSGATTGGYRLLVNGTEAGTANAFTLDLSGLTGGVAPVMTTYTAALDATLTVDGIEVTADSNNPDDVITGVTLNLLKADPTKAITVTVTRDTESIAGNLKGMVTAYNDLFSYIQTQSAVGGVMRDNPALRAVASRVENMFSAALEGGLGDITHYSDMGVTRLEGRQIKFDETKFKEVLSGKFGAVRDFFIKRDGNTGKAYELDQAIDVMTRSTDGLFKISTDALNKRIEYTDSSIDRYERSIESYQLTMQRRFTAMEQTVSQLQSQGSYLNSIVYQQRN
jgi:flagellar hook-associated protein 2